MNEIQNDSIKSTLIKIETLQKEYEVVLQQYQEAGKNYIESLQLTTSNPCSKYKKDSVGISQKCYEQIWTDQGCTDTSYVDAGSDWAKTQTLEGLVNDSYLWATLTDDAHRQACYKNSTTFTSNTEPVFPKDETNKLVALKGRTWWGTSKLDEGPVSSQEECENMCVNSTKCSGATFNPVKKYCWTRTGDGNISVGRDDDYALITQQKSALSTMKFLNTRLLELNEKITDMIRTISPKVEKQYENKNETQIQLNQSYDKLLEQKIELDKQMQEYYSIEQEENSQSIYANQQNTSYRFWVLITCLVLLFTINKLFGSVSQTLSITIWILIIVILIILTYTFSTPSGLMLWFIVIIIAVILKR